MRFKDLFADFKVFTAYNLAIVTLLGLLIIQACNSGKQLCLQSEKPLLDIVNTNNLVSYDKFDSIVNIVQLIDSISKANLLEDVQLGDKLAFTLDNGKTLVQSYAHITRNDTLHIIIVEYYKDDVDVSTVIYKKETTNK